MAFSPPLLKDSSPEPTSFILTYPEIGGIEVSEQDVAYLEDGMMINDTIIDFYLTYIHKEIIPAEFQESSHIFNTFFYTFLLRTFTDRNINEYDAQRKLNKWIKNIDIFSKDFIFVPVNRRHHWFLVVICFLTQLDQNNCDETKDTSDSTEPKMSSDKNSDSKSSNKGIKVHPYRKKGKPCFCIFDSLDSSADLQVEQKLVIHGLKRCFELIWIGRNPNNPLQWEEIPCYKVACPQQENGVDCGLFLLQYVESFFKKPIQYFNHPMPVLKNWFSKKVMREKRASIKQIISELRAKQTVSVQLDLNQGSDVIKVSE